MGDNRDYLTHPEEMGSIHISEEVLASIASGAVSEVEGISGLMNITGKKTSTKGVRLQMDEEGATIDVYVMIRFGYAIPDVAEKIQTNVASSVEAMTGFTVKAVNVHVGGVSVQ